jgi:hypothetical protein
VKLFSSLLQYISCVNMRSVFLLLLISVRVIAAEYPVPEVIPGPGLPSLSELGLTSEGLYGDYSETLYPEGLFGFNLRVMDSNG